MMHVTRLHPTASLRFDVFEQRLKDSLIRERLIAALSVSFGALALVLAAIRLYGVMSYSVSRRRGEFAVRTALGASRGQLVRMVLGDAMSMILMGLAVGGAAAILLGRSAESLLYGLESADPLIFVASIVTLSVTGVRGLRSRISRSVRFRIRRARGGRLECATSGAYRMIR